MNTEPCPGGQLEPIVGRLADERLDELRRVYGNAYCEQRKAGIGGAEAERFAMREVLRSHLRNKLEVVLEQLRGAQQQEAAS